MLFHKILVLLLMGFALVVATYSEMVILLDNHILNLNVRQIARILLKMLFKMKLFLNS